MKRYERVKILKEKEKWKEDDTIFGLPKVKVVRFRIKKEKAVPAAVEGAPGTSAAPVAEGARPTTPTTAKAAPASVKAAGPAAKGVQGKSEEKKK